MFNWYERGQDKGFPGMKADSALDVVDSFQAGAGGLNPGDVAALKDGVAAVPTDADKAFGVVLHFHKEPADPYYAEGDTVPVLTFGDVYVTAAADVKAGDPAAYTVETGFIKGADTDASGNVYLADAAAGSVVPLRIRNAQALVVNTTAETPAADKAKAGYAVVG